MDGNYKGGSEHLSKVLGEILKGTMEAVQKDLKAHSEAVRELHEVVVKLEASMHHPPCPDIKGLEKESSAKFMFMQTQFDREILEIKKDLENGFSSIRKGMDTHKQDHKTETDNKEKLRQQITAGVLILIIFAVLGYALIGFSEATNNETIIETNK